MGVSDLWPIFDDNGVSKDTNLSDLRGKRVAVDLSCWTMQSKTTGGLNLSRKPHLKILFYRTKALLFNGILPIFVMEGKAPECKGATIRKRLKIAKSSASGDISRATYDRLQVECQELLHALGVPCVRSAGEAEAFCAFLNSREVVNGCITEDNDAFLYGAKIVYRSFTTHQSKEISQLKAYAISDIEQKMKLNRNKLIALALLLGCDYIDGVPGIGRETALKLIDELEKHGYNILERFRDWRTKSRLELFPFENTEFEGKFPSHCKNCGHPGKQREHKLTGCNYCGTKETCNLSKTGKTCMCGWHQNFTAKEKFKFESKVYDTIKNMENFSYEEVISEYLEEKNTLPAKEELVWSAPDIVTFQEKALDWFGWKLDDAFKAMFPVYIFWQITQKLSKVSNNGQHFLYKPLRIEKIQQVLGVKKYKIIWESLDEDNMCDDDHKTEYLTTLNDTEDFARAYPRIVSEYEQEIEQKQVMKEKEKKAKRRKEKKTSKKKSGSLESNSSSSNKVDTITTHLASLSINKGLKSDSSSDAYQKNFLKDKMSSNEEAHDFEKSYYDIPLLQRLKPEIFNTEVQKLPKIPTLSIVSKQMTSIQSLQQCSIRNDFITKVNISPVIHTSETKEMQYNIHAKDFGTRDENIKKLSSAILSTTTREETSLYLKEGAAMNAQHFTCALDSDAPCKMNKPSMHIEDEKGAIPMSDDSFLDLPLIERLNLRKKYVLSNDCYGSHFYSMNKCTAPQVCSSSPGSNEADLTTNFSVKNEICLNLPTPESSSSYRTFRHSLNKELIYSLKRQKRISSVSFCSPLAEMTPFYSSTPQLQQGITPKNIKICSCLKSLNYNLLCLDDDDYNHSEELFKSHVINSYSEDSIFCLD